MPESIREEYNQIIIELEKISNKHQYTENIIGLQMRYAKLKGKVEHIDINRVVQDALNLLSDTIKKNNIEVMTSFKQGAMVSLEESKLLQILFNVIKNGCEAMLGNKDGTKKLFVTTNQYNGVGSDMVVSVRDTGCGFTHEEENKMFAFGYSTKNRGTGFGLHSSANYLIANNGSIHAKSDGPASGAEFIIHLSVEDRAS